MSRNENQVASIKVIGVGGGGSNAVDRMINSGITSAEFFAVNTDKQALMQSKVSDENKIQIGAKLTKGLGAGADPEIGNLAAEETKDAINKVLEDTDLLFITAGMGGGTGTGAAPVVAQMAQEKGILTVAVITKPFEFEGKVRGKNADLGMKNLRKYVDTLVVIPNQKLLEIDPGNLTMVEAFRRADDVLRQGIQGISDLIVMPSMINLDFADVKSVMKNDKNKDKGFAHMGIGKESGPDKVEKAVKNAVFSPLLETKIEGATGIIINVKGGTDLPLSEINEAVDMVRDVVDPDCNIIFGAGVDEDMGDEVEITVIATGFAKDDFKSLEDKQPESSNRRDSRREQEVDSDNIDNDLDDDIDVDDSNKGRIEMDDDALPPFLRRLREKNNKDK